MWRTVNLGDVVSYTKSNAEGSRLPYVGMENIASETLELIGDIHVPESTSTTFEFNESHVLFGRLRPYLRKVLIPSFRGQCSTEIFCLKPSCELLREYLAYWLLEPTVSKQIVSTSTGARMPRANMNKLLEFEFVLPPLAEQQRIVAKLDAAFAEIDRAVEIENEKNVQIKRLLSNTIRAKIQKMMVANGSKPLADFCELKNGFAFKSTKFCDTGTPILRISNIQDGSITTDKMVYASQEDYKENLDKYIVKKDALLIAMSGATTGKVGINRSEQDFYLNQRVGMLIPNTSLDRDFLYFFLTTKVNELLNISAGAAQPNLSATQIREIELPNITLDEQKVFSESINGLKVEIDLLQSACAQKLAQLATVKSAILAQELQPKQSDAA